MQTLTKAQKARVAIRNIKTMTDALTLRGYFKPGGRSGLTLSHSLRMLSPEIYGTMNDYRIIELKGLEYVIERLPEGIENFTQITLTAQEDFEDTAFKKIIPPKRRRTSYKVNEKEICFIISRGLSEIYDILTHLTFLNNEADKIYNQVKNREGDFIREWNELETVIQQGTQLTSDNLDQAIWNLSMILGRSFHETRNSYHHLEQYSDGEKKVNILFQIIYGLGMRINNEKLSKEEELLITFTPSLQYMIVSQNYGKEWAGNIKQKICELGLQDRPIHIISANMHSILNLLYGYAVLDLDNNHSDLSAETKNKECYNTASSEDSQIKNEKKNGNDNKNKSDNENKDGTENKNVTENKKSDKDIYSFISKIRAVNKQVKKFSEQHGLYELLDASGTHIDCQIIDTAKLENVKLHPDLCIDKSQIKKNKPVIIVMDYAFGTQAFESMDELLEPVETEEHKLKFDIKSISIMGKAGILAGNKGDIMLSTAFVFEGTSDNYIVENDLKKENFNDSVNVYTGPLITVVGTSLQNIDLLKRFQTTSWKTVGLEMEGGYYQKAISSAIIRGHVKKSIKTRYAYYASDNPLESGQTLSSGSMGSEGVRPTYLITKIILEKILGKNKK